MNYYEHEIKVKFIDGVLAHEQDWEWFIQHTENTFDVELKETLLKRHLIRCERFVRFFTT